VAIRYGTLDNGSYVALPLAENNRRVLVASPAYLAKHGPLRRLDDLLSHQCLLYTLNGHAYDNWVFAQWGIERKITVSSRLLCDDADVARRWAVDGMGIAYKSWIDVCADVLAGRLTVLLPEQPGVAAPLHLICPHRKQFSPAIRQLHGMLREHLQHITGLI